MGDFEDVFGAGADADSIIDGFSREAMRHQREEEAQEQAEWEHFVESVFLAAKIEDGDYSIFLNDFAEVEAFDRYAKCFHTGEYEFSFSRRRDGSGYRVFVDRNSYNRHFTRSGRIVIVPTPEEAMVFSKQSGAEVFDADALPLKPTGPSWSTQLRSRWDEPDGRFLELLDVGQEVVLWGWWLEIVFRSKARFIGWKEKTGFEPIVSASSLRAYRWKAAHHRRGSDAGEQARPKAEPTPRRSPYSIVGLEEYMALKRAGKKAKWEE